HEYQAFWKEYCCKLFKRKPQQSNKCKDSPRSQGQRHNKDKNDINNIKDGKKSVVFIERQYEKVQIRDRTGSSLKKTTFGKRVSDKSSKFYRTIIQRRQGFKPQDYNDGLKDRIQKRISNLQTWAKKSTLLIQIAERILHMQIFLKCLRTTDLSIKWFIKEKFLDRL
ncbi:MAG: hypothetical protein EZS28_051643, partial [Streblomastix strix]